MATAEQVTQARQIIVNLSEVSSQLDLDTLVWVTSIFGWDWRLHKQPPERKDRESCMAAALWEVLVFYFSVEESEGSVSGYPFITDLLAPEDQEFGGGEIEELAKLCVKAAKWVAPLRQGQQWYGIPMPEPATKQAKQAQPKRRGRRRVSK